MAFDNDGNPCALGDVHGQTHRCLEIIETALKKLGADRSRIVATRMYTTNIQGWGDILKAHGEFFHDCPPTTMLLGVNELIAKEFLVEIEAQAQASES